MTETRIEIFYKDEKYFDKPMGSPRPRFRRVKQFVQTYMPTHYTKHKNFIADQMPPNEMIERELNVTFVEDNYLDIMQTTEWPEWLGDVNEYIPS